MYINVINSQYESVCYKKCTSMSSIHNKNYIFMNVAENDDIFIIFLRIFNGKMNFENICMTWNCF